MNTYLLKINGKPIKEIKGYKKALNEYEQAIKENDVVSIEYTLHEIKGEKIYREMYRQDKRDLYDNDFLKLAYKIFKYDLYRNYFEAQEWYEFHTGKCVSFNTILKDKHFFLYALTYGGLIKHFAEDFEELKAE